MSDETAEEHWVHTEFGECPLKDCRRVQRLEKIAADLMKQPRASINEASGNWAASKAAYRFFATPLVADDLLSGHRAQTVARSREWPVVLAVQDTTVFNFTRQRGKQGLGSIGAKNRAQQGFYAHTTLAVEAAGGIALGVLDLQSYVRQPPPAKRQRTGEAQQRESVRWLRSLARCQEAAQDCGEATQIVSVADREADFYEFFVYAVREAPAVEVLVRAKHDRELEEGRLFAQVRAQPALGTLQVEVPRSGNVASRTAHLEMRARRVQLRAPQHWRDQAQWPMLELWAIEAWEMAAPAATTPICWRLLTTLPAPDLAAAVTIVGYYTRRWTIEVWHKILKSGCQFEDHQLESFAALERVLRVDAVIAWRVLYLISQGRAQPHLSCAVVLEEAQWKALHAFTRKAPPPKDGSPPSLGEAMLSIARLGGFLARKGDGQPGSQVLWRGLAKLDTITQAWIAFSSPETCG